MLRRLTVPAAALLVAAVAAAPAPAAERARTYQLDGVRTVIDRAAVAASGAAIVEVDHADVVVTATRREIRFLTRRGYRAHRLRPAPRRGARRLKNFPTADSAYHNYAEMNAEIDQRRGRLSRRIVSVRSIGTSYEGRDIRAIKISDNVGTDESEPEVLFTAHQHAREHLTVEMALYLLHLLTDGYATDSARSRTSSTPARSGSSRTSTRTAASTTSRPAPTARGARTASRTPAPPPSAPTSTATGATSGAAAAARRARSRRRPTAAPRRSRPPRPGSSRDFVTSRVVGGKQQISMNIDWHTYAELVLWPYGYTTANTTSTLTADDQRALSTLGRQMAATNGYTPEQAQRPVHRRRDDQRLDVERLQDLQLHVRDVSRPRRVPGSIRPTSRSARRRRATARPRCS